MRRNEIFESLELSKFQKLEKDSMKSIVGGGPTASTTAKKKKEGDGTVPD